MLKIVRFQAKNWLELKRSGIYAIVIRLRKYVSNSDKFRSEKEIITFNFSQGSVDMTLKTNFEGIF